MHLEWPAFSPWQEGPACTRTMPLWQNTLTPRLALLELRILRMPVLLCQTLISWLHLAGSTASLSRALWVRKPPLQVLHLDRNPYYGVALSVLG